ncbi:MAG: VWA domain-containing protein [Myxococcota bacterium]
MSAKHLALSLTVLGLVACVTDVDLGTNHTPLVTPNSSTTSLHGALCTPVVTSPLRIIIAIDAAQSILVTDPNGTRATAVSNLLNRLPRDPNIGVAVALFRGNTVAWLTGGGQAAFDRVVDLDSAEVEQLRSQILNFVPGSSDSTDFVAPLSQIYGLLAQDLAQHQSAPESRPRYAVYFVSDGEPTVNQDDELICGDAVRRIRQLADFADEVTLSTVHLFAEELQPCTDDAGVPTQPACGFAALPIGACPQRIVDQHAQRLARMAELGGGTFQDVRFASAVSFDRTFAPVQRRLVLDTLIASNLSAPAGSPTGVADSDGDGLVDVDEGTEGTQAQVADSDGDGFSDGVEVFVRARGAGLSPVQANPGCPAAMQGVDTDCDGLLDCDEQLIGTDAKTGDTDADGVPDVVEFKLGSQPVVKDLADDPDQDSRTTGAELAAHLDPQRVDVTTDTAYRTTLTRRAALETDGSQCWDFSVDNVRLADTLGGTNDLFVSYSMRWEDQPAGRTFLRTSRHPTPPTDAGVTFVPTDFSRCQ